MYEPELGVDIITYLQYLNQNITMRLVGVAKPVPQERLVSPHATTKQSSDPNFELLHVYSVDHDLSYQPRPGRHYYSPGPQQLYRSCHRGLRPRPKCQHWRYPYCHWATWSSNAPLSQHLARYERCAGGFLGTATASGILRTVMGREGIARLSSDGAIAAGGAQDAHGVRRVRG